MCLLHPESVLRKYHVDKRRSPARLMTLLNKRELLNSDGGLNVGTTNNLLNKW